MRFRIWRSSFNKETTPLWNRLKPFIAVTTDLLLDEFQKERSAQEERSINSWSPLSTRPLAFGLRSFTPQPWSSNIENARLLCCKYHQYECYIHYDLSPTDWFVQLLAFSKGRRFNGNFNFCLRKLATTIINGFVKNSSHLFPIKRCSFLHERREKGDSNAKKPTFPLKELRL